MKFVFDKWIFVWVVLLIFVFHPTNSQEQFRSRGGLADTFALFEKCGQIQEIPGDLRTRVPWTVAIYTRDTPTSPLQYFLMGALLGPSTVISIFGGAYGALPKAATGKYRLFKPENVVVVAGIKSSKLNETDEHAQFADVEFLQPYNDKNPNNQDFHFFIINLKTPFDVSTPYVRPICLVIYRPSASPYVKWDGFASSFSTSIAPSKLQKLLERRLTVYKGMAQKKDECESAYRYYFGARNASHIYCARVSGLVGEGDFNTCASHGGPSFVFLVRWWFLNGLGAVAPVRRRGLSTCDQNTLYFIAHFINQPVTDWARNQLECGPKAFTCNDGTGKCLELSKVCNGIKDCPNGDDEDTVFCKATNYCKRSVPHSCHLNGKCIKESQLCDHLGDCVGDSDERQLKCLEDKLDYRIIGLNSGLKCSPIPIHEGVKVTCFNGRTNQEKDCEDSQPGDNAYLTCHDYFTSKLRISSMNISCDETGTWSPTITFACTPECGVANSKGQKENEGPRNSTFPWHAAIFHLDEDKKFGLICGGTLIEETIIVTSAQCLTEPTGLPANLRKFKIILAPSSDQFEENDNNPETQIFSINRVWIAPKSKTSSRNFVSDIAMARLNRPVQYNDRVRAACYLQPHLKSFPRIGQIGQLPHLIEQSKWTTEVSPVVPNGMCSTNDKNLSDDSFCISSAFSCTPKDSGSGLFYPILGKERRYVFKGIVTDGDVYQLYQNRKRMCNGHLKIMHVDSFSHWIFNILENSYRRDTLIT